MQIKFYTLTALVFLLVVPILGAPVPSPSSPSYPSIFRRKLRYAEGTVVQLKPNSESVYRHPIEVTFGSAASLPGRAAVDHVSTTDAVVDSTVRLVAVCGTSSDERTHLRQMKLVVFEGADQGGDQWVIIREPQGLNVDQVLDLKDADLKNIVKNSANLVKSLSLWKIGGTKLEPKHVKSLQVEVDRGREVRIAALYKVAGRERLRLAEDFNLLQVEPGNDDDATSELRGLQPYLFEVKNGLIQSAHLTNWEDSGLLNIDGKSLTQEQKDGIVQFKYLNGKGGLPLIRNWSLGKRKGY